MTQKDNDKEKNEEAIFDLFGLGNLFKGVGKLVDIAGKLEENRTICKEGVKLFLF